MVETSMKYPRKNIKFSDFKQAEEANQKIWKTFCKMEMRKKEISDHYASKN